MIEQEPQVFNFTEADVGQWVSIPPKNEHDQLVIETLFGLRMPLGLESKFTQGSYKILGVTTHD